MSKGSDYQRNRRMRARANKMCGVCCRNPSGEQFRCVDCKARQIEYDTARTVQSPRCDATSRVQATFVVCCQSFGRHRSGCGEVMTAKEQR